MCIPPTMLPAGPQCPRFWGRTPHCTSLSVPTPASHERPGAPHVADLLCDRVLSHWVQVLIGMMSWARTGQRPRMDRSARFTAPTSWCHLEAPLAGDPGKVADPLKGKC